MNTTVLPNTCHDELPSALMKQSAEDFRVDEQLGFEPEGDGEHLWVQIRKTGRNTRDVVDLLGKGLSLPAREIGTSGLKDRHAVTTQWMSLPTAKLENKDHLPQLLQSLLSDIPDLECLQAVRGRKKLKTGTHKHNHFTILLRDITNGRELIEQRLSTVVQQGFPNYFGMQRFGRGGRNLVQAKALFEGRIKASKFKRGMYLSAARAYLFNRVLALRVEQQTWNKVQHGDACILDGSNSLFPTEQVDTEIEARCAQLDIHPSGPMVGNGESMVSGAIAQLESDLLATEAVFTEGLANAGLRSERRALRAVASDLQWRWLSDTTIELQFALGKGVFATSLLAEIASVEDARDRQPAEAE